MLKRLINLLANQKEILEDRTKSRAERRSKPSQSSVEKNVLLIVHNPKIPSEGNRTLQEVMKWNDPIQLTEQFIVDLRELSHGYANYKVVETIVSDEMTVMMDGFQYGRDQYVQNMRSRSGWHSLDRVNYEILVEKFNLVEKVNSGLVDEVWFHGYPYGGFYESRMMGDGAFWCNSPQMPDSAGVNKRFVMMAYNFERGVGEMLESYAHRVESIMEQTYRGKAEKRNMWHRYVQYDKTHPTHSNMGSVHFAPNSDRDYDWGNDRVVYSCADDWLNYPYLTGESRPMSCEEWGGGDIYAHKKWWLSHIPHFEGQKDGIANNWWQYIVDPNLV